MEGGSSSKEESGEDSVANSTRSWKHFLRVLRIVTSHPSSWQWSLSIGRKTQSENSQQDGFFGASPEWHWVEASGGRNLMNREPAPQHLEGPGFQ
ncbi:Transmembrane Channel-Like Protein 7 [Manis pentadactyla]|nr:Transmembrane Channel-Like Protein 7 [Manis pentadactyla]